MTMNEPIQETESTEHQPSLGRDGADGYGLKVGVAGTVANEHLGPPGLALSIDSCNRSHA